MRYLLNTRPTKSQCKYGFHKAMLAAALLCVTSASACANDQSDKVRYKTSQETIDAGLPFSDAVQVGDVLYMSGQMGFRPGESTLVEGGIEAQTHQIFANMKGILQANGSSMDKVFKCTVMLGDIGQWPDFNAVYVSYFPGNKPARSAFGAAGLAQGGALEMECWAMVD